MKKALLAAIFCLLTVFSHAQTPTNCPGTSSPPTNPAGWCGVYTAPMIACQTHPGVGCATLPTGWTANVGFYTTTPGTGTVGSQFPGIAYSQLVPVDKPYYTPNAVLSVGAHDVIEYVNSGVQAFSKTTGQSFFITKGTTTIVPQNPALPFSSYGGSPLNPSCGNLSIDVNVTYNQAAGLFVLSGVTNSAVLTHPPAVCIAVSSQLENPNGKSLWNAYGFDLTALEVSNGGYTASFDYPRFGTFNGQYWVAMDYIDQNPATEYYQHIMGFVVCGFSAVQIDSGVPTGTPENNCVSYLPKRNLIGGTNTSLQDALYHSLLPADQDTPTVYSGTSGEYFYALANPVAAGTLWYQGNPCYQSYSCAGGFDIDGGGILTWTQNQLFEGLAPSYTGLFITAALESMPGCYNPWNPDNTFCVMQPGTTNQIDGVSDRLSGRAAYANQTWTAVEGEPGEEFYDTENELITFPATYWESGNPQNPGQGVLITTAGNGGIPLISESSEFPLYPTFTLGSYPTNGNNYWLGSVAINSLNNICATFTQDNAGSSPQDPSIYSQVAVYQNPVYPDNYSFLVNPQNLITTGLGVDISDGSGNYVPDWGNYVSMGIDPNDGLTCWGVKEYLTANQTPENLTWATTIFKFQY